jgi:hypothetical protein
VPGDVLGEAALARARAGDEDAFRELTDPYRREVQLHCLRETNRATYRIYPRRTALGRSACETLLRPRRARRL